MPDSTEAPTISQRATIGPIAMGTSLPIETFVPVTTNKLVTPTVTWTNGDIFSAKMALDNSFCVRQDYEPVAGYTTEDRTQLADRYGGYGVGHGGGSGRCSTFGNVQIKGVGQTPLVTLKHDRFHSSGTVSLPEAGREAIWSQILSVVLPYGTVSPLAIVLTGGVFTEPAQTGMNVLRRRSLLMREFVLRPAHYLRNLRIESSGLEGLCQDAHRTSNAINMLHRGFDEALGKSVAGTRGIEKINLGLRIMAKRFAAQVATSFAKRVFHGSLNCSNIALDGRFLDFGVTTFVESYRRRAWAEGWPDQWAQQGALLRTLHLLRFHLQKYLRRDNANGLISEAELVAEFQTALAGKLEIEMLKMTGVPEDVVLAYPLGDRKRLFRCMRKIYSRGANEAFIDFPAHADTAGSNPPPSKNGRFDLNAILALASTCVDSNDLDRALTELMADTHLRKEFVDCYGNISRRFVSGFDPDFQKMARIYMTLQATRLNSDLSFLRRELMDEQLAVFDADPEGIGAFIDATVDYGKYFLQQDHPDLLGNDTKSRVAHLTKMEGALPDFVMTRLTATHVSALLITRMERLLQGKPK